MYYSKRQKSNQTNLIKLNQIEIYEIKLNQIKVYL